MTMKEIFKKVAAYNEIAALMYVDKAQINFIDYFAPGYGHGEHFDNYDVFRKHIRREYVKGVADQILGSDEFEIDGKITFEWDGSSLTFEANLITL